MTIGDLVDWLTAYGIEPPEDLAKLQTRSPLINVGNVGDVGNVGTAAPEPEPLIEPEPPAALEREVFYLLTMPLTTLLPRWRRGRSPSP